MGVGCKVELSGLKKPGKNIAIVTVQANSSHFLQANDQDANSIFNRAVKKAIHMIYNNFLMPFGYLQAKLVRPVEGLGDPLLQML